MTQVWLFQIKDGFEEGPVNQWWQHQVSVSHGEWCETFSQVPPIKYHRITSCLDWKDRHVTAPTPTRHPHLPQCTFKEYVGSITLFQSLFLLAAALIKQNPLTHSVLLVLHARRRTIAVNLWPCRVADLWYIHTRAHTNRNHSPVSVTQPLGEDGKTTERLKPKTEPLYRSAACNSRLSRRYLFVHMTICLLRQHIIYFV